MCGFRPLWTSVVLALAVLTRPAEAQTPAQIEQLSEAFEAARIAGDDGACQALLLDGATAFDLEGNACGLLSRELSSAAARQRQSGSPRLEPVRVVRRQVALQPGGAVVTELIGASDDVAPGDIIVPRRRTIVWMLSQDQWKIGHLHTSPYTRWEKAITGYEQRDAQAPPEPQGVVFVGSSSFLFWKSLAQDFPDRNVLGRGFGGSQLIDSVLYAHRIVIPYRPRAVVVYAGDNDIADGQSAEQVFQDFQLLVATIRKPLPETHIGFVAIKPSIMRWGLWPQMQRANALIEHYADHQDRVDYLDVATPMLGPDQKPRKELLADDGLHLSPQGYALWTTIVTSWLETLDRAPSD